MTAITRTPLRSTPTSGRPRGVWHADDERFFRIVQGVFPAAWLAGASVLLASSDDEDGLPLRRRG